MRKGGVKAKDEQRGSLKKFGKSYESDKQKKKREQRNED